MPFTFFAHQAPVIPLKLAKPRWFDGTALCIGSMAPDLGYPLGSWLRHESHTAIGIVAWAVPVTVVISWAIRRWVATTAFAQLPDLAGFRLHSYRVLARGRPALLLTATSALVGASLHVIIDAFTHADRFGARALGYDDVSVTVPGRDDMALAHLFQDAGHVLGTIAGIALFFYMGRRRVLERWYGTDTVAHARAFTLGIAQRVAFWSVVACAAPLAALWISFADDYKMFRVVNALALTTAVACGLPMSRPVASDRAVVP